MSPSCKTWMIGSIAFLSFYLTSAFSQECADWKNAHPEWIFCDDFESVDPLVGPGRYFEVDDNNGDFVVADAVGLNESRGIRIRWQKGEVVAGSLKFASNNPDLSRGLSTRTSLDIPAILSFSISIS